MTHDLLFHGGVGGRRVGDVLLPGMAEHRYVKGCAHCEAQRNNVVTGVDPPTPPDWVYACADRAYGRWYASRAVGGTLYRVRLEGDVERSLEDPDWSWAYRARRAVVVRVIETNVTLTMLERRKMFIRFGGSQEEFKQMLVMAGVP